MTQNGEKPTTEVARITGVQGIRAAMSVLAREGSEAMREDADAACEAGVVACEAGADAACEGAGVAACEAGVAHEGAGVAREIAGLANPEAVVLPHVLRTCPVCAAQNEGENDTCWSCGSPLLRSR